MKKTPLRHLLKKRHNLIPGAAHTYSKGDDQFPAIAPPAILRGKGAYVWGSDGKKYLDWCMGLRSVSLGHVDPMVNRAVQKQLKEGTNFGRPHPIEYELAHRLTDLLPGVEMVKFAKAGSAVTTAAVKLARAYTNRSLVALCADHPFFSYDDWFIGTTPANAGVPEEIKKLSLSFRYNDLKSLEVLFRKHPRGIACVIMEVVTTVEPDRAFLRGVQALCKKYGALLILDEMITGFRFNLRGAAPMYGLKPDLITYGKGIANGFSVAVLGGRKDVLEQGGIRSKKPRVFLLSATHGAETISLAAALTTLDIMEKNSVQKNFWKRGTVLKHGLEAAIRRHHLEKYIEVIGFAPNLSMTFKDEKGPSPMLRTIFLQEVIRRGILFQGYFAISASHTDREIRTTLKVFDEALTAYRAILDKGEKHYADYLIGEPCKSVFRRFN